MSALGWILAAAVACVVLALAGDLPLMLRLRRLRRVRAGVDGFATFRAALPEVPEAFCRDVYAAIQSQVAVDLPLLPDDDLRGTLEIDEGGLADLIEELVPQHVYGAAPLDTAADLVRAAWRAAADPRAGARGM
jgi:hypothetical protein